MKKTIFSVIFMTFALVLGSCCNGTGNATVEAQDSTAVDSVVVDTMVVDSTAVIALDSVSVDSIVAE